MADGGWGDERKAGSGRDGDSGPRPPAARRLDDALAPETLWAVCGCGADAPLDPRPWLALGLRRHPLHALEDRLRCPCGARAASLEVRGREAPAAGEPGGPYIFR
jgi:hypothetical protein